MTNSSRDIFFIGVISDTHGRLPASLPDVLKEVDLIIHAGDMDDPDTLNVLKSIAPVIAVRGNMDRGAWAKGLNKSELVEIKEVALYVVHDIYDLDIDPESVQIKAVISGHTHRPSLTNRGPVLYVNPGSATNPRDGNPTTVAILHIENRSVKGRLVEIPV